MGIKHRFNQEILRYGKTVNVRHKRSFLGLLAVFVLLPGCLATSRQPELVQATPQRVIEEAQVPTPPRPDPSLAPAPLLPRAASQAAIVIDAASGRTLFAKQAESRRAVASTQKLLTALVVLEAQRSETVSVPAAATRVEPSKLYLKAGEEYPQSLLVDALLVKSANDVATTLAYHVSGSQEAFMARMNEKAKSLGMNDSYFLNPHGLTEVGQYSTAHDVARLARAAYQNPTIRKAVGTRALTFSYPDGRTKQLANTNRLLKSLSYCTGMKTGTTRASGFCLVSSGSLDGRTCFAVVLGAPSRAALYADSERLLRWALER